MTDLTQEQMAQWESWLAGRPADVVELARRLPPWTLYRIKSTGQVAQIVSYGEMEDGSVTITANVWRDDIPGMEALFARQVFGMNPDDFEVSP
jgi:hypothetical protein